MKHIVASLLLLGFALAPKSFAAGPFGFEKGMTRAQVIALVGHGAVKDSKSDVLTVTTAPKPHSSFEFYTLVFSPTQGLLKVIAGGRDIETGDSGSELQSAFAEVVDGVTRKYGQPLHAFDFCNGGVGCTDSSVWMLGLLQKNRTLASYWQLNGSVNNVSAIEVEAKALRLNTGYVSCAYEFEGWSAYLDVKKAAQNDNY